MTRAHNTVLADKEGRIKRFLKISIFILITTIALSLILSCVPPIAPEINIVEGTVTQIIPSEELYRGIPVMYYIRLDDDNMYSTVWSKRMGIYCPSFPGEFKRFSNPCISFLQEFGEQVRVGKSYAFTLRNGLISDFQSME